MYYHVKSKIISVLVLLAINFKLFEGSDVTRASGMVYYPDSNDQQMNTHNGIVNQSHQYPTYIRSRIRIGLTRNISNLESIKSNRLQAPEISYFGALGVGSPAKMFNVVFDTGSSETWLPYNTWWRILADNLHYSIGYKCKESSTCKSTNKETFVDYRNTNLSGQVYEDYFTLYEDLQEKEDAALLISRSISFNQNFLGIEDASNEQFRYKPYDGVVGLSPNTQSSNGIRNLLLSLQQEQQQNNINNDAPYPNQEYQHGSVRPSYNNNNYSPGSNNEGFDLMFSFYFNPNQNSRHGGELMLGGVDENRFYGEIHFHKIVNWLDWRLPLNQVLVGGQVIDCQTAACSVVLDTAANSVVGPREVVEGIYQNLQAQYQHESDLWLVDCNKRDQYPLLTFRIYDSPYSLSPHHYIRLFKYRDSVVCYLAIKPWDRQNEWLFGTAFIGAYYTVFDLDKRRVGFASPR